MGYIRKLVDRYPVLGTIQDDIYKTADILIEIFHCLYITPYAGGSFLSIKLGNPLKRYAQITVDMK
jgi:hypothetical protein